MGLISALLARRRANKFAHLIDNCTAESGRENAAFAQAFEDSAWCKRYGKYDVSLFWIEFAEQPIKAVPVDFPTVLDALLWLSKFRERFGLNAVSRLNEDYLTRDDKLRVAWYQPATGKLLGSVTFLPNRFAEEQAQMLE